MHDVVKWVRSRAGRLALSYFLIIALMTALFSIVIYETATIELDRPARHGPDLMGQVGPRAIDQLFQERADHAKARVLTSILLLDSGILLLGAVASYWLALWTLRPIEQAMEAQARFVSDASHELRTPLTALQTSNEVALRDPALSRDAKELAEHNVAEVGRLRTLSEQLLSAITSAQSGRTIEQIEVHALVHDVVARLRPLAKKRSISIETRVQTSLKLSADRTALSQVITNLLDNAIKYSPEHSAVVIEAKQAKNGTILSIKDRGAGIPKNEQARIFDRFYRADASRSVAATEGTGLGLAIVKTICDRHGMSIDVTSTPGKGSTFTITVPT